MHFAMAAVLKWGISHGMAIPFSSYFSGTPAHKTERNKKYKLKTTWNKYFGKEKGTGSSWKEKP